MARRRSDGTEINFDGLTDSVTNLVGALVLVVVLVIAVTKPKVEGVDAPPPPENTIGAEQPIGPLLERIHQMQQEVDLVTQEVQQVEDGLPSLTAEVAELRIEAASRGSIVTEED